MKILDEERTNYRKTIEEFASCPEKNAHIDHSNIFSFPLPDRFALVPAPVLSTSWKLDRLHAGHVITPKRSPHLVYLLFGFQLFQIRKILAGLKLRKLAS